MPTEDVRAAAAAIFGFELDDNVVDTLTTAWLHREEGPHSMLEGGAVDAADELYCRMFGFALRAGVDAGVCKQWQEGGCGCPVEKPESCPQPAFAGNLRMVGWEETPDQNTAITYSFEKEWVGEAPGLHHLFQPAGKEGMPCDGLWVRLGDTLLRAAFMAVFHNQARKEDSGLKKYRSPSRSTNACYNGKNLPLKRSSTELSIFDYIEVDGQPKSGPWEVKADSFYYDLEAMETQVWEMLKYLGVPPDVPPSALMPDGFPAERRVQVHVVAPLKRRGEEGEEAAARNQHLRRSLRLIQLYFSDFLFLRLAFPYGPRGEKCKGRDELLFQCDVFSDTYNDVITMKTADAAWGDEQEPILRDNHKFEIVGIRGSDVYGGAEEIECSEAEGDCDLPCRVGFEIRKSASFDEAVSVAKAISRALQSMDRSGDARVGVEPEQNEKHIGDVKVFAQHYRMKWRDDSDDSFCSQDVQTAAYAFALAFEAPTGLTGAKQLGQTVSGSDDAAQPWVPAVKLFAAYLYSEVGGKELPHLERLTRKLWKMLALLLCTDWKILVGDVGTPDHRFDILSRFKALKAKTLQTAQTAPKALMNQFGWDLESLRQEISKYAFDLSTGF